MFSENENMNILVLCADYPNLNGEKAMNYVHVRNLYYKNQNIIPVVLSLAAVENYSIDGVEVITLDYYQRDSSQHGDQNYKCLVCHAPNIRNHYCFLKNNVNKFKNIAFIFHGHEIVKINETYPKPYEYTERYRLFKRISQSIYDSFKLFIWRNYLPKIAYKSQFVFVSNSLFDDFCNYVKPGFAAVEDRIHIIPNSVGETFEKSQYDAVGDKQYDFITIRSDLDSSVYCLDLITGYANKYPQYSFLVIGKGKWFDYNTKPDNITFINSVLDHERLITYVDQASYALMPTRRDSQGVLTCELLTYGIPVITSDLPVCREICDGFNNYILISNDINKVDLTKAIQYLEQFKYAEGIKIEKYFAENTARKEVGLLKNL
ncbi:MAG TPA: glycosyltransferase [Candidatus Eisenbacteria bacterium]|nr:glycosyltransferase [Candidatus Eisenbacteria bacterium]